MEYWTDNNNFPKYQFSSLGRIKRIKDSKILVSNKKYPMWGIYDKNNNRHTYSPTRVLREHFPYEWIKHLEEGEECKEIQGHPGYYITTKGRVWSMTQYRWLEINQRGKTYYYYVGLGGKEKGLIHMLVGRNFLPEYRKGLLILHKEETLPYPQINYLENFWVGTSSDNNKDTWEKGRNHR